MGDKKRKRRYSSFLIVIPVNTKVLFPFLSLLLSRGGIISGDHLECPGVISIPTVAAVFANSCLTLIVSAHSARKAKNTAQRNVVVPPVFLKDDLLVLLVQLLLHLGREEEED